MDAKRIQKSTLKKDGWVDKVRAGEFPAGLKVLIIDDDETYLLVLERMFQKLFYEVTKCQGARDALALLREDTSRFDLVICDLNMPDMDGFKLLDQIIRSKMDLPVVLMSSDDRDGVVLNSMLRGACDCLAKPVSTEAIRFIWKNVVRWRIYTLGQLQRPENVNLNNDRLLLAEEATDAELMSAKEIGSLQSSKQGEDDNEDGGESSAGDDDEDSEVTNGKKRRMVWTGELHDLFAAALDELGRDKCVPKKILERMQAMNPNIELTRANIASHLQKYRLHLRRLDKLSPNREVNALFERAASSFPQRHDLQLQAQSCYQLPMQNLITNFTTAPSSDHGINIVDSIISDQPLVNREVNALFERATSAFRQPCNQQALSCHQLPLQNLIASPTENDNLTTAPRSDDGSNIFESILSESSRDLPPEFSLPGLPPTNSLYPNDSLVNFAISDEDYMYRNVTD